MILKFNEEVAEFLSLDLNQLFSKKIVAIDEISSHLVETLVINIFNVTRKYQIEEFAVDDMARLLFLLFKYGKLGVSIRSQQSMLLEMSNEYTKAVPDLCLETLHGSKKLLVQEDKSWRSVERVTPQMVSAQLVAEMVAAFQQNVITLACQGQSVDEFEQDMLGIVMSGTCPTFYRMKLTEKLSQHVKIGKVPAFETELWEYSIPNPPVDDYMNALLYQENALHIAQCFEAMKHLVSKNLAH